ncbi:MAG: hypothetical protein V4635_06560 [Bacteroidota bacterium]
MKQKHYLLFYAWTYALISVFLLLLTIFNKPDETGLILGSILILVLSYKSYSCFKKLRTTNNEDRALAPPANASLQDQKLYYKRMVIVFWIAITILSIWTITDLNELESGTVEYVGVWGPVLFCYHIGGYWLAVLVTPLIGLLVTLLFIKKINQLKKAQADK